MITNGEIFSEAYLEHLKKIDIAQQVYRITQNKHSKKILDDLQSKEFSFKERFNEKYIQDYLESKKVAKIKAEEEITHIINAMNIEDLYEDGKISLEERFNMHQKNDDKFNLTFAL
jgi:Na+-transporting NADH:ubiquinone oxidoreductase subunit NqrC